MAAASCASTSWYCSSKTASLAASISAWLGVRVTIRVTVRVTCTFFASWRYMWLQAGSHRVAGGTA